MTRTAVNQLYGGLNVTWSIRLQSATYPRIILPMLRWVMFNCLNALAGAMLLCRASCTTAYTAGYESKVFLLVASVNTSGHAAAVISEDNDGADVRLDARTVAYARRLNPAPTERMALHETCKTAGSQRSFHSSIKQATQ